MIGDRSLALTRAERATLVPACLARVPLNLPLAAPLPRECLDAMPLLEAIEHRANAHDVAVDSPIECGRTHRHAPTGACSLRLRRPPQHLHSAHRHPHKVLTR